MKFFKNLTIYILIVLLVMTFSIPECSLAADTGINLFLFLPKVAACNFRHDGNADEKFLTVQAKDAEGKSFCCHYRTGFWLVRLGEDRKA